MASFQYRNQNKKQWIIITITIVTRAATIALHIVPVTVMPLTMVKLQVLLVAAVMPAVMRAVHVPGKVTKQTLRIWNQTARTNRRIF